MAKSGKAVGFKTWWKVQKSDGDVFKLVESLLFDRFLKMLFACIGQSPGGQSQAKLHIILYFRWRLF